MPPLPSRKRTFHGQARSHLFFSLVSAETGMLAIVAADV
jgi:hypothetical protein